MSVKKLDKFGGMLPAWEAHLIPDGQADNASNCYLFSGALNGWRKPKLLRQLTNSAAKFAYRLPTITEGLAHAYLVFRVLPNDGDTETVGDVTYTWTSSITATTPQDYVLIGADVLSAAHNFLNALTFDNGAGTNQGIAYSNNTTANPQIAAFHAVPGSDNSVIDNAPFGPAVYVIAPDFGAAYNSIAVDSSSGHTVWLYDLLDLTHTTTTFTGGINPSFDATITSSSLFLEFLDPDTTVIKSQVVNDQFKRYYFASPSVLPEYNTTARINAGLPPWVLGIPPPACAPGLSISGGGNTGTLGATTTRGGQVTVGSNLIYLLPITPTGAILANDISFLPGITNTTVNWQGVIYEDVSQGVNVTPVAPGQLLAVTPVFTGLAAGVAATATFTNPPGLNQAVSYWIGIWADQTISVANDDGLHTTSAFAATFSAGAPLEAPGVFAAPGFEMFLDYQTSDVLEARAYLYTWISAYGEESAPSPPTLGNGWSNGTWTVGLFNPPPDDLGGIRNLAVLRLYRTVSGTSGLTTYYQVADISLGSLNQDAIDFVANDTGCGPPAATYVDSVADNIIATHTILPSTNFFPPPEDLQGFVILPNGCVAAWKNNEVWFCEPYFPHAWPPGYTIAVDFPIVGLGVTSGAIVACTSASPYVMNGVIPGQFSSFKCTKPEPCTSRGSIVSLDSGVYYISPNGLIQVPNTGALENKTQDWIKREDWNALVPQKNTRSIALASTYFCWGSTSGTGATEDTSVAQVGFNIEVDADTSSFTIWPQAGGHRLGIMPMTSPYGYDIDNLFIDPWTGQGVLIMNGAEYWYDFSDQAPSIQPYDWLSKKYQEVAKKNYSALRIYFTVPPNTPAQNPNPNIQPAYDPSWDTLQDGQWGIVKVWADPDDGTHAGNMVLVMARELRKNGQVMRVPDGFKAENWQIEIMARVVISNIQVATSVQELGQV